MLCLHLQRSHDPWRSYIQPFWPSPVDLFTRMEQDILRSIEETRAAMRRMERLHQQFANEMVLEDDRSLITMMPPGDIKSGDDGFKLSLGVRDFSPHEITVKLYGRKLLVTGAKETKNDDGKGSYSYKCQIFRKEADLPRDVRAQDMSCVLTSNGQLDIEAPWQNASALRERNVPILLTSGQAEDQKPEDDDSKQKRDSKP